MFSYHNTHLCHSNPADGQQSLVSYETVGDVQLLQKQKKVKLYFRSIFKSLYIEEVEKYLKSGTVLSNKCQDPIVSFSWQDHLEFQSNAVLSSLAQQYHVSLNPENIEKNHQTLVSSGPCLFVFCYFGLFWFHMYVLFTLVSLWLALRLLCRVLFSLSDHFLLDRTKYESSI